MSHMARMLIGCLLPLALIFVLPLFGVGSGLTLLVFFGLMFMCHLMMMGGHGHGTSGSHGGCGHGGHDQHTQHDKEADDERTAIHQHPQH